ncbi:glucose-6-phosphate isomerase [candidate division KSB1 bacterium]|nr:glucose-6-phosphate isomerase [candidate division KSB1 bacterium]
MDRIKIACSLGEWESVIQEALSEVSEHKILQRIFKQDHTVWKEDPTEITNRLAWLEIPEKIANDANRLQSWADKIIESGFTQALLLGMGGSSLAPEVLQNTFGVKSGYLDLHMLDSTDPDAVKSVASKLDPDKTLFIVATKSGGTSETRSFMNYFFGWVKDNLPDVDVGSRFIAITDPGSSLDQDARSLNFRDVILNDPNIGGRFSALSYFGIVPAALMGLDIHKLLASAVETIQACHIEDNPAVQIGVILGKLAKAGVDKATFVFSDEIAQFGDWVEQLIAESTGKENRIGILPVIGESLSTPDQYEKDRVFVAITLDGDDSKSESLSQFIKSGHPVVEIQLKEKYDLGGLFFLWELITAIACEQLRVNPFDQPHVQTAKTIAKEKIIDFQETQMIPRGSALEPTAETLSDFIYQARPGDYITIQAFVQPTQDTDAAIAKLKLSLRHMTRLAVTSGYGPRFLHSTGQLHKGDSGKGLFLQFISDIPAEDVSIPDAPGDPASSISFGVLRNAQALGDYEALLNANRRVIRFDLGQDVPGNILKLIATD